MDFYEAALVILQENGRPMTAKEIIEEGISRGLIQTKGKTPESTMDVTLTRHLRRDFPVRLVRLGTRRAPMRWALYLKE